MVGKEAIEQEGIDDDQDQGEETRYAECVLNRDALMHSIRVLKGNIAEGEVLVERFDRI